jgi:outer membrane receptor protein involved in Fe transport
MKTIYKTVQNPSVRFRVPPARQRAYWAAIALASLACGGIAKAQTSPSDSSTTNVTKLNETTVTARLNAARSEILPSLGATKYTFTTNSIQAIPGGENASFNTLLLRAPGVVQDSAVNGDLHVRGEHANLQYRIDGVILPEGITGFGLELDPRFVERMSLITGALPAQYGFRTAGIVDITTKSGAYENGGEGEVYFGSHDTIRPSFELGGTTSNFNYYVDGSYTHTSLGIENPVGTHEAIHDKSDQGRFFTYDSYNIDDTSRLSLMLSASDSNFQVPNVPGDQSPGPFQTTTTPPGLGLPANFDSAALNENQNEQNYYGALTYQKSAGDLNYQISALGRRSSVHFVPDQTGDLFFFGETSDVDRTLTSGGLQGDGSYNLNEYHTLRGGFQFLGEVVRANSSTVVYDVQSTDPASPVFNVPMAGTSPRPIVFNENLHGFFTGFYLQDEWKMFEKLTVNYGARFDIFNSSFDNENQFSPRVNFIYKPWESTTLHAGYSHYFTPPPIESVPSSSINQFTGTSGASQITLDSPVKCERAEYFDVGISQKINDHLTVGVDGYYKYAKNQLDDGLFGQTLILSAFNYAKGQVDGVEFTANYTDGGFSTYGNVAIGDAMGTTFTSGQFLFDPAVYKYVNAGNYIHLDHLETLAMSSGVSYLWKQCPKASMLTYVDAIFGTGLRTDLNDPNTPPFIPNGGQLQTYYSLNVGLEERLKVGEKQFVKLRLDVVNLTDQSYALRDGNGVGVGAPQFSQRRSFYGTIGFQF